MYAILVSMYSVSVGRVSLRSKTPSRLSARPRKSARCSAHVVIISVASFLRARVSVTEALVLARAVAALALRPSIHPLVAADACAQRRVAERRPVPAWDRQQRAEVGRMV